MQVTLIGRQELYKIVLPKNPIGNYWLSDKIGEKERKLINIEGKGKYWRIKSDDNVKVINSKSINITNDSISIKPGVDIYSDSLILQEHSMYAISIGNMGDIYILYCSPAYESETLHLNINRATEFYIGRNEKNQITYKNSLVAEHHARIFNTNGRWLIENFDQKTGTFVNNAQIGDTPKVLFNGDVIFIAGLKIIIMGNSIFINNPLNAMNFNKEYFSTIRHKTYSPITENKNEDEEIELYKDDEYFSRAPRITNLIEKERVKIDPPPQIQGQEEMPAILVLGSSLSMGVMMMISMIMTIDGRISGTATTKQTIFQLLMSLTLLVSMILFPILIQKWEKRRKIKYEQKRQKRYKEYLKKKIDVINKISDKQKKILFENYISAEECSKIILEKSPRLWERKIEDYDFLHVRLGLGDVPLKIDIQYPEEQFEMEDDNLVEILKDIAANSKVIESAPIVTPLVQKNISALIVKDDEVFKKMMQNIIIQLIALHSYEDLKLVFLVKKENEKYWEYVKMLPHVWSNSRKVRFFANDFEDMSQISNYLEQVLKERREYDNADYKSFMPYYLIITDDYKRIENLKIITEVQKMKVNLGFSMLCITNDLTQAPNECKTFISLEDKKGIIFDSEFSENNQREVTFDTSHTFFFEKLAQTIFNIPIRYSASAAALLPNTYTFLEMYDVGLIEQLNVLERWRKNDSTLSLKAPIGIDSSGMPIVLDIHEKAHGPHGLIAGSTGAGKSEFIITYILSLAINYHPDDVNFLLIDYKGGGVAGAFQKKHIKLPHLVGTITNIDTNDLQRSLASIKSEMQRRQIIFNEAREIINEGTMDIYKYQKLYNNGIVKKPIPHLLIICDEFAELKQQQEEFMDELISVSRIGRSLGVHLILATQKPAGIVNEQIRSNSKFAICLKVQEKEDSYDVIKRPDAVSLKTTGQFYMQVGNDDYFVLGQSAWSGAPYYPSAVAKKKVDNSIQFISNVGVSMKEVDDTLQKNITSSGEQLTNIVKYIDELAKKENIKTENLWLEKIPENIFTDNLKKKYNVKINSDNIINIIIGEYDDPYNQKQGLVEVNLSIDGNMLIYGSAESGKETLLSTMVYELMTTYDAGKVWMYLLDFGSEAMKIFKDSPNVGDVVFLYDEEKVSRFFDMMQDEIRQRRTILSNFNGDYNLYINTSKQTMPMIVVMLNNYEAFSENYGDKYDDALMTVTREGIKCGIIFIVTASAYGDLRYRLTQNFKRKIALQLNNEDDYYNIYSNVGKQRPSHIFGRGLISLEDGKICEFQTAKICEAVDYNLKIEETISHLKEINKVEAKAIPVIPDRITISDVKNDAKDISNIPIGMSKKTLKLFGYDFKKNFISVITSKNLDSAIEFTSYILEVIKQLETVNVIVFDAEKVLKNKKENIKEDFKHFVSNANSNKSYTICVIIGVDKFVSEIENEFYQMLSHAQESEKYSFILVENINRLKNHEYDEWYKNFLTGDTGIYVGNGIDDQYTIIINDRQGLINNCGRSFGYVIRQGIPTMIKLLGMKENGDENE